MSLLEVVDVTIEREQLPIVRGACLAVDEGQVTVLLGVNGAGKTTLLEGISGAIPLTAGEVLLGGERIDHQQPYRRARRGLAHVEQGRAVFPELSTRQNLVVAAGGRPIDEALDVFPALEHRLDVASVLLSGGEQQMLVLARAFLQHPRVLMIDEMSLGLAPLAIKNLMEAVVALRDRGLAILLVEQFAALALAVGARAYVLRGGEIVYDGQCSELRKAPGLLQQLYLGEAVGAAGGSQ